MSESGQNQADAGEQAQPQELTEPERLRLHTDAKHVCPFCGTIATAGVLRCQRCGMDDSPETRQATRSCLGPWFVLQSRNPAAPGMNFATLLSLVRNGQVTPTTVVRGPTTQQSWTFASRVKGLSREFGVCWDCGQSVRPEDNLCPHCQRLQEPPMNADVLIEGKPPGVAPEQQLARAPAPSPPKPPHERILSQKDLAAAFAITALPNQPVTAPEPIRRRRRARPGLRAAVIALFTLCAAAGGYYAYDPAGAKHWYAIAIQWAESKTSPPRKPPIQPTRAAAVVNHPPESEAVTARHQEPAATVPASAPAADPIPDPLQVDEQSPAPAAAQPATAAQATQAISLLAKAIQAERENRFATAANYYEQIRQLPKELWPVALDRRLQSARERAGN